MIEPCYRYHATVDRVIDGDTYLLRLDLGFRASVTIPVRVRGYNAPEMTGVDRARGTLARATAVLFLSNAKVIVVETYKDTQSFSRWIGDVYVDGVSIAQLLTDAGHTA
jgi:endonuclease YncB( thermonuclease family)